MTNIPKRNLSSLIRSETERSKNLWRSNLALFISLVSIIFIMPVIPGEDRLISHIFLALIVVSGLYAAEFRRIVFRILFALGALVITVTIIELFIRNSHFVNILSFFLYTLFFIMVTVALVAHVARAKTADRSTVLCAINSYLLLGLTASIFFIILDLTNSQSFAQIDFETEPLSSYIYFGFVTLSTLGYGDISPTTPLARSLSTFTALFGQLYLVIVMALIIGKYLNSKSLDEDLK